MDSFYEVSQVLEKHHSIFSKLWDIGKPTFTDNIERAAIGFNKDGGFVEFVFNPDFYDSLSVDERAMVVAHECLHVILNHGVRIKDKIPEIANIAMDIVINEMLVSGFNFNRNLPICKTMYFHDVVFPQNGTVERNREFEYYYRELMKNAKFVDKAQAGQAGGGLDDHSNLPGSGDIAMEIEQSLKGLSKEESDKLVDKLKKSGEKDGMAEDKDNPLNKAAEEKDGKNKEEGGKQAGTSGDFSWIKKICKKIILRKWEKLVKKYVIKAWEQKDADQFIRENRRFSILSARASFLLPSEYESEDDNSMIDVVFFMDISGSCAAISEKFFQSAKTIPQDKFIIDAYAFNTGIIKVDLKSDRFPSGGGTSFHQLEEHLQQMKKKTNRYPSLVFVLTDGYGSPVNPEHPNRWHIFLTENCKSCFPNNVNFHNFEDYACD